MFKIDMLPAGFGDCLWIEYGEEAKPHRILIDGGVASTYSALQKRISNLPPDQRHFELFIITHIDADHIEGAIKLLGSLRHLGITFKDIWFNGWRHLLKGEDKEGDDWLGGVQGEFLSALIEQIKLPWNEAFAGSAIVVPNNSKLPCCDLAGGMKLTLLSPSTNCLLDLRAKWSEAIWSAGLDCNSITSVLEALNKRASLRPPDDLILAGERTLDIRKLADTYFISDSTKANGSSIAVLAEYEDKRCLFTGDAHVPILYKNIQQLIKERGDEKLHLNALKLSHHGSKGNISIELLKQLYCSRYLFSTNGSKFRHPDREAVARVIVYGGSHPSLIFNYRTEFNKVWDDPRLTSGKFPYEVQYPSNEDGVLIDL